jgi:hypothetical protein
MDQQQFQRLLDKIDKIEERTRRIEINLARQDGQKTVVSGIGAWINGIITLVLAAYFEWKFNRLN